MPSQVGGLWHPHSHKPRDLGMRVFEILRPSPPKYLWATLCGTPVIQGGVSIAKPSAPPTEDSDMLVLNSRSNLPDSSVVGAEVLFLHLRLSLSTAGSVSLKWAFSGLRATVPLDEVEENPVQYHWKYVFEPHGHNEPPDEETMAQRKMGRVQRLRVGWALPSRGDGTIRRQVAVRSARKHSCLPILSSDSSLRAHRLRFSCRRQTPTNPPDSWWCLVRMRWAFGKQLMIMKGYQLLTAMNCNIPCGTITERHQTVPERGK